MKNFTLFLFVITCSINSYAQINQYLEPPIDDSWIYEANPNNNYGNSNSINVGKDVNGAELRTLIKWDLNPLQCIDSIYDIQIRLLEYNGDGPICADLYLISGIWDEATVTWNNQPSTSTWYGTQCFNGAGLYFIPPNESLLQEWLTNGNNGIMLKWSTGNNGEVAAFESGEAGGSDPRFIVDYTVGTSSTAPTSINPSQNNICPNTTIQLTKSGGSLGTGAQWEWYTGSCGGTWIDQGMNISVSPTVTTTYYVRAEGACNTTSCASVTVTVNTNSTAPSSASASPNPVVAGNPTTLSFTGGSLGTGATWEWYSGSCGGTPVGSGTSPSVSPTTPTIYYVRAEGTCNTTLCVSVLVDTIVIGIEEITSITNLSIYPNPNSGQFVIEMELAKPQEMELELLNVIGQAVYKEGLGKVTGNYQKHLDLKGLAKGIYTLQLTSEEGTVSRKIILE